MKLTLGEECLILRRRLRLKFIEASKLAKISPGAIGYIERDSTKIPKRTVLKYKDFLEVYGEK